MLTLTLLCSTCAPLVHAQPVDLRSAKNQPIAFNSTLLKLVDGTPNIEIGEIFFFARNVLALISGTKPSHAQKIQEAFDLEMPQGFFDDLQQLNKVGFIYIDDKGYSLKELLQHENQHGIDEFAHNGLIKACQVFEKIAQDYEEDIDAAKPIMVKIISDWSTLRQRPNTVLLEWSRVETSDRDGLYKIMDSCHTLNIFLHDLLLFLQDLVQNCPKSHKLYREQLKHRS